MPVVAGLYAFLAAVLMFALLGANRTMSVGADSTIAPMLAAAVTAVAGIGSARYGPDMALLALLVGAVVIVVGVARMGWIADFLSVPVVTGFLAGIAVIIVIGQLPAVLGLPPVSGNATAKLVAVVRHLGETNLYALAVAVVVFAVIVAAERISRRVPGALIGVLLSLAASAVGQRRDHAGHAAGRSAAACRTGLLGAPGLAAAAQRVRGGAHRDHPGVCHDALVR
jgi:MFS superfamily sulfate permease-like transporter